MSKLDSIKSKPTAKRLLKGVHFDWSGAEITYTSGLGAASGHNDMVLSKSVKSEEDLSEGERAILSKIGKEFVPLEKSISADNVNVEPLTKEGTDMSVELQKQLDEQAATMATLVRDNSVLKVTQEVKAFGFEADLEKELAEAIVDGDNSVSVLKALNVLKSVTPVETESAITKELGEAGYTSPAEEELAVVKSISEQLKEKMKAQAEGAK